MKTVLIFGASGTHGVGGARGGWADKIKLWLHQEMFGPNSKGQQCIVYELGIVGDTTRDVVGRFEVETLARLTEKDPKNTFVIFSAGANDSRATGSPENYLHTPEEYAGSVYAFIKLAKKFANHILCVGLSPVNQAKVHPKHNPLTGGKSYFDNQRLHLFEDTLAQTCQTEKVPCLALFDAVPARWTEDYLATDGMHPNDAGHQWIFEQVKPALGAMLKL